jgi:hypothetical protein
MIIELTQAELDFVKDMAERRAALGKQSKRVSRMSDEEVSFMGIAGEFAAAKGLRCSFNPFPHRGGDGHKGDLTRGPYTISLKTRARHLPADFLFPTRQDPGTFPDDFGVVGRWLDRYWRLELVGWFSQAMYPTYKESITVGGTRSGTSETRNGFPHRYLLTDIERLKERLDAVEDETVSAMEKEGYIRYFRDRDYSRGSTVNIGDVYPQLANLLD